MGARGSCTVCYDAKRAEIDAAKAGGVAVATLARNFGLATSSAARHFRLGHARPAPKAVYERLHPEAKAKSPEKQRAARTGQPREMISPGFTADTHAKTGLSQRTIQHEVQIGSMPEAPARYQSGPTRGAVPFARVKEAAALLGVPAHELTMCVSEHLACDIVTPTEDQEEALYALFDLADEDEDYVADVARHGSFLAGAAGR